MHLNNINNLEQSKKNNLFNNINNYFIQIDYFDEKGTKKYNDNIPLKYVLSQKTLNKNNIDPGGGYRPPQDQFMFLIYFIFV